MGQKTRKLGYILLAAAMVITVSIIGCSPPTAVPPSLTPVPTAKPTPPAPVSSPTPTTKPTPSPQQPKSGGILRYYDDGDPGGWDPQRQVLYSPNFTLPIFNNLVQFDPSKREIRPENIVGDLAEKWDISSDGKTYTFYLNKNIKWHDGKPFSSKDVVANFVKLVDKTRSAMADQISAYQRAEAVDDYTVKVYLSRPQPSFLAILATGYCPMVPADPNLDWKSTNFLVGTGPFKLKKYTTGVSIELERNRDYFKKDQFGNQLPYLDGIQINVIKDRSAQVDALVTKRIDMLKPTVGISSREVLERVKQQVPQVPIVWANMGPVFFWFNLTHKPFDDIRIRQALTLATDMKDITIGGFGAEQFRDQSVWLFAQPYGVPVAEKMQTLGWDKPMDQRIAQAKKLLADAGYSSGLKVTALTNNLTEFVKMQEVLADQWRKIGVETNIVSVTTADRAKRAAAGDFDILSSSPSIQANDPDEGAAGFVTKGSQNMSRYSNAEFDKLKDQQSVATDLNTRVKLTRQMEKILLTELPMISQGAGAFATSFWPWVKGFIKQDAYYTSYLRMERVWIDETLRK